MHAPDETFSVQITAKVMETPDVCSLELQSPTGADLPAFSAGAHVDVYLPGDIVRQYSLCNNPAETHRYRIAVLREPASRGGSQAVHEKLHAGDAITITKPKNHFPLGTSAKHRLLMAGGIGVTPILCMAQHLNDADQAFTMHYSVRTAERLAFVQEISCAPFASYVHFHTDDGLPEQRLDLEQTLRNPDPETHLYVCGPQGYMDAVLSTARAQGWSDAQLHWEFFSVSAPVPQQGDRAFEVQLSRSGQIITVAADETVVQALAAVGIEVPTSCEQGVCGTCLTRVLAGEIDHRDVFLTSAEHKANDQFTPCCSRALSQRLTLDL